MVFERADEYYFVQEMKDHPVSSTAFSSIRRDSLITEAKCT